MIAAMNVPPPLWRLRFAPRIHAFRPALVFVAGLCAIAVSSLVAAIDGVQLDFEQVEGDGWSAYGISAQLRLPEDRSQIVAHITRVAFAADGLEFRDVRVECPALEVNAQRIRCRDARITAVLPQLGVQRLNGDMSYARASGALDLYLDLPQFAQGSAGVNASWHDHRWSTQVQLRKVAIAPLMKLARQFKAPLPELTAAGVMTASIQAQGSSAIEQATIGLTVSELTASNVAGSLATEQLAFTVNATLRSQGADWKFDGNVQSAQGQMYAQPVFMDLGAHAMDLKFKGHWQPDRPMVIERFELDHRQVSKATGSATLAFDAEQPLRDLKLKLQSLQFPGAYDTYFQPLLLDTSFKALKTAGAIAGEIEIAQGVPSRIDLQLDAVSLNDEARSFVLDGLQGEWHWLANAGAEERDEPAQSTVQQVPQSRLSWHAGVLLGLQLGASTMSFTTSARNFRLLEPARIPVFDGAIELDSFRVRNAGTPKVAFMIDATIRPIDVSQLSKAFGWPEFGGSIGGVISKLRMREGLLTLGTQLSAQVFDGSVTINDLRLEQPFGQWPRFSANIALDNLDLELVTGAFSFGRITGRMSGAIDGLQMFNWMPVAFDAHLHTPPGDRSKHRISQRAVQNIGSIGGGGAGVTAALSSGFLKFFEDFNYERLGVSCRLQNDVCSMDGVTAAPNGGYYLVKGKGVPRIDVIGNARRVDWPRLVQQLIAATQSEGPVVGSP
jgi:hypothetical protein